MLGFFSPVFFFFFVQGSESEFLDFFFFGVELDERGRNAVREGFAAVGGLGQGAVFRW